MRSLPQLQNMQVEAVDPACTVPPALQTLMAAADLHAAISSSFAFGGTSVVLALMRA